ncbi:MAG: hypothetical protein K2O06_18425 [Acetatifactor sp.]|nr:hypothetical protein [Acetatifactor sp.]
MANEIKKVKIKELPHSDEIHDDDLFVESDGLHTYHVTAHEIAAYVAGNRTMEEQFIPQSRIGVPEGIVPFNAEKKIDGSHIIYGNRSNTAFEGSKGEQLEQALDSHLNDSNAHGFDRLEKELGELRDSLGSLSEHQNRVSSEIIQSTEPATQKPGDFWLCDY